MKNKKIVLSSLIVTGFWFLLPFLTNLNNTHDKKNFKKIINNIPIPTDSNIVLMKTGGYTDETANTFSPWTEDFWNQQHTKWGAEVSITITSGKISNLIESLVNGEGTLTLKQLKDAGIITVSSKIGVHSTNDDQGNSRDDQGWWTETSNKLTSYEIGNVNDVNNNDGTHGQNLVVDQGAKEYNYTHQHPLLKMPNLENITVNYDWTNNELKFGNLPYLKIQQRGHEYGGLGPASGEHGDKTSDLTNISTSYWKSTYKCNKNWQIYSIKEQFDFSNFICIDTEKSRVYADIKNGGKQKIAARVKVNEKYWESVLGFWSANHMANKLSSGYSDFNSLSENDKNLIKDAVLDGKLWGKKIGTYGNVWKIPQSDVFLFDKECYQNETDEKNKNSLLNCISFAKNPSGQNLTQYIASIPSLLSWKHYQNENNWTFELSNPEYDLKERLSKTLQNSNFTLKYDIYEGESAEQAVPVVLNKFIISNWTDLINGKQLDSYDTGNDGVMKYYGIKLTELRWENDNSLTISNPSDAGTQIQHFKEIDALSLNGKILNKGKSILTDDKDETVEWTDETWNEFLNSLKFISTKTLCEYLTEGSIYIDGESVEESPLYHYTVSNIDISMFCGVKEEWQELYGTDPDILVKSIEFDEIETDLTHINITITTNEEDSVVFDNSNWWSLKGQIYENTTPGTFPVFTGKTVNQELEQVNNDPWIFFNAYTLYVGQETEAPVLYKTNYTQTELETDFNSLHNPIELIPNNTEGVLNVKVSHHEFFVNGKGYGDIVTDTFTINSFLPVPPPPPAPPIDFDVVNPVEHPQWGLIFGLSGLGLGIVATGGTIVFVAHKRKNRKISLIKNKVSKKQPKTGISDKFEDGEV